jgi:hypothetical protein
LIKGEHQGRANVQIADVVQRLGGQECRRR